MANISKNSNIAKIPAKFDLDFFILWLSFLKPFHKLTNNEIKVLAAILLKRHELFRLVKDEHVLNNLLKSTSIRREIRESISMEVSQFNISCTKLRKCSALIDNAPNKRFIPNIEDGSNEYRLILIFDLNEQSKVNISK